MCFEAVSSAKTEGKKGIFLVKTLVKSKKEVVEKG